MHATATAEEKEKKKEEEGCGEVEWEAGEKKC